MAGVGLSAPIGNTHKYETPSYGFQFGGGRNFNKVYGLLLQFDYDHFGLQGDTLANQNYLYDYGCTASSSQAFVRCLRPRRQQSRLVVYTQPHLYTSNGWFLGAYAVVGGGFYHKVTNFTEPTIEEYCYYYCEDYQVNANIDHYTSNAVGVNGGFGLTYKFSKFSNERFYMEARYVYMANSTAIWRHGLQPTSVLNSYTGYNLYPAEQQPHHLHPGEVRHPLLSVPTSAARSTRARPTSRASLRQAGIISPSGKVSRASRASRWSPCRRARRDPETGSAARYTSSPAQRAAGTAR